MKLLSKYMKKSVSSLSAVLMVACLSNSVLAEDLLNLPYNRSAYDEYFQTDDEEVFLYNGNLCYDIVNYPLVTYKKAYLQDEGLLEDFYIRKSAVDTYLMDSNISSLPKGIGIETAISDDFEGFTSQKQAVESLFLLFLYYSHGEIVPKNDYEAVKYLSKLVQFYESNPVENEVYEDSFFTSLFLIGIPDELSSENPLNNVSENEFSISLIKQAIAAGSIEMKAVCLSQDFDKLLSWQDKQWVLSDITKLAEKGSRTAIHALAKIYGELAVQDPEQFNEFKYYWQQREIQLPPMKQISWH